ncbi:hypothetical protein [Staphylococcus phage 3MRA]|uniref:Uncharacterized protein n=1 Tax=Staphylococcus phage 3MRA TaxID=1505026 RepID=A0A0H3U4W5_9CAUD|nr:hypothetical protein AVU46_gp62 [Staphylococcus phage 3MRA]AIB56247.1 hypothetical protein [Staphylococcus phage 3MRA]
MIGMLNINGKNMTIGNDSTAIYKKNLSKLYFLIFISPLFIFPYI